MDSLWVHYTKPVPYQHLEPVVYELDGDKYDVEREIVTQVAMDGPCATSAVMATNLLNKKGNVVGFSVIVLEIVRWKKNKKLYLAYRKMQDYAMLYNIKGRIIKQKIPIEELDVLDIKTGKGCDEDSWEAWKSTLPQEVQKFIGKLESNW